MQRAVVDGGDHRVGGDVVAGLDRQYADDAFDRRRDRAAVEIELRVAQRQLRIADDEFGVGHLHQRGGVGGAQRLDALELRFRVGERDLGAVERNLLDLGIKQRDHRACLDLRAGCDLDLVTRPEV